MRELSDHDAVVQGRKARKGLVVSMVVLASGWLIFFLAPGLGPEDTFLLAYPVGWLGIMGSLLGILACVTLLWRHGLGSVWPSTTWIAALIELILFVRVTCLPMYSGSYGPWWTMLLAFHWALIAVFGLGIATYVTSGRKTSV